MTTATVNPPSSTPSPLRIGAWRVDPRLNELSRDGEPPLRLEPKVMEVLVRLAERAGEVVSREELLAAVWPGVVVGDDALTQAIIKLRRALGDDAHKPTYIETISKRGYRLIAPVHSRMADTRDAAGLGRWRFALNSRKRAAIAIGSAVLVVALAATLVAFMGKSLRMPWPLADDTRGAPRAAMPVVAILPLGNLSGDPNREYFTDGLTEDLIGALGRFSGVRVMSRNAVQPFKGKSPTPRAIREELGASYIVKGSVREMNRRLRVVVELSDAPKGELLWSERYDVEGTEVFELQDRIAKMVVGALHVKLTEIERQRIFTKPTDSLEAYDLVLRARALGERPDRRTNREARELLARAEVVAPDYAEVLSASAEAELNRARYGWVEDAEAAAKRAEQLAKRALLSPDTRSHLRAHSVLAAVYDYWCRTDEALSHTERAIALNPSDSEALYRRGETLVVSGRVDDAIPPLEEARRLEPNVVRIYLVVAYFHARRYQDAVALADSLLARSPDHVALNATKAAALAELGNMEEAHRAAEQVRRSSPNFSGETWGNPCAKPDYNAAIRDGLRKAGL